MLKKTVCVTLLLIGAPVIAQQNKAVDPKEKSGERIICQKIEEIGSRLASKRVCMTANQWRDQQLQEQEATAAHQRKTYMPQSN